MKKTISITIPCYNEEKNIEPMTEALIQIADEMPQYQFEIIFRDNASTDDSRAVLRRMCEKYPIVKAIFNARNYGADPQKSTFYGRVSGDVVIGLACDFQDPPELIPEFIKAWEEGYEVVCGIKTSSEEGKIKYQLRQLFYSIIDKFSEYPNYRNMSGIMLRSRRIFDMQGQSKNRKTARYFLADLGIEIKLIPYKQKKRRSGKSSYNLSRSLSFAINSLITTSKKPLRITTLFGLSMAVLSGVIGCVYLILKLLFWTRYPMGTAPILIGMFFLGSIQLLFIGVLGEYVGFILNEVTDKLPPVVTDLIGFDEDMKDNDPYYFPAGSRSKE